MFLRFLRHQKGTARKLLVVIALLAIVGLGFFAVEWFRDSGLRSARSLFEAGDLEAANNQVISWEREYGATGRSQALQARILVALGRHRTALRIFEQIGAADFGEMHSWATAYLSLQQWSRALPLLQGLHEQQPENADILHEMAACQAQLGQYDEALKTAELFKSTGKSVHRALLLIGSIQMKRGNDAEALKVWNEIRQFDPEYKDLQLPTDEFLTQFASLHVEQGQVDRASELLQQALKIRESAEAWFQFGLVADLQGQPDEAQKRWLNAIRISPDHLNARESLARQELTKGDAEKALSWIQPALKNDAVRSSTAYLMQRIAQLKKDPEQTAYWQEQVEKIRRRETIDSTVRRILTENPNSYWARIVRSYQFAEQGNMQQAKALLDEVRKEGEDPFVTDLRKAIESGGSLPEKDRVPINLF